MQPLLQFIARRIFYALLSLIVITMILYAGMMLTPPEARVLLYAPPGRGGQRITENWTKATIARYHLADPYPVQYGFWVSSLLNGSWGYSPTLSADVLPALVSRTPVTLELALYSLLLLIPLGLASGLLAGWNPGRPFDQVFRGLAFFGTSMPLFIFALALISLFYIKLGWFVPGRLDVDTSQLVSSSAFHSYTGMLSIDGLLNGRLDVFLTAIRHLAMPVITLSLYHWATLGRVTRKAVMGERYKDYIMAARARGVDERRLLWEHALRPIMAPSLTAVALSAAAILTGVFVVEIIFNIHGVSEVIVKSMNSTPDASATLGFSVYSVIMVVVLMFILDILQAILDPRVRDEVLSRS